MSADEVKAAIESASRAFEANYSSGNAALLVESYFAADEYEPKACPPGGTPPVRGRAALAAMFGGMIAETPAIRLETIEVTASDDVAFELGRAHLTGAGGEAMLGRYTVCWIKTPDGWRAKTDFFAADGWA